MLMVEYGMDYRINEDDGWSRSNTCLYGIHSWAGGGLYIGNLNDVRGSL